MNAEVIAIGTELLLGFVVNTDTVFLGRVLAGLGIDCYHQVTVGDNKRRLAETIRTALDRSDLVITCGGLGPTVDDVTLETIAAVTEKPLELNKEILRTIEHRFKRARIRMPQSNRRQALLPRGATFFPNSTGTAPGFVLPVYHAGKTRWVAALPGPPFELIPMTHKYLIPHLKRFSGDSLIRSRTLKVTGVTESEVDAKVADLLALEGAATLGIYAHPGQIDLRITAKAGNIREADRLVASLETKILRRLGKLVFGADEETLEGTVGALLKKKNLTLGLAESCTGGLVAHRLTEIPGSSGYFSGSVVSYSNDVKNSTLGVPAETLKKHGAVSPQTARAMAQGARRFAKADIGLALTGIAGPSGGSAKKPVGLVYIALSLPSGTIVERHRFSGTRALIKQQAAQTALNRLRLTLLR